MAVSSASSSKRRERASEPAAAAQTSAIGAREQCRRAMYRRVRPLTLTASRFLRRPQELLDDDIYQQLAATWFAPPHRDISIALTAKSLGAVPATYRPGDLAGRRASLTQNIGQTVSRLGHQMYEAVVISNHGARLQTSMSEVEPVTSSTC